MKTFFYICISLTLSTQALADRGGRGWNKMKLACENKEANADCSFEDRSGVRSGKCEKRLFSQRILILVKSKSNIHG